MKVYKRREKGKKMQVSKNRRYNTRQERTDMVAGAKRQGSYR